VVLRHTTIVHQAGGSLVAGFGNDAHAEFRVLSLKFRVASSKVQSDWASAV
jgi:hypothetical protein